MYIIIISWILDIEMCTENYGFSWEDPPACVSVLVHGYACIIRGVRGGWQGSLENLISLTKF